MTEPVPFELKPQPQIVEAGTVWVSQLTMNEVVVRKSNGCHPVDVYVPTKEALFKHDEIRGQIGQFYGTWRNRYRPAFLGLPWGGYGAHFTPDRANFFDRNYNQSIDDEVGLLFGLGLGSRRPKAIIVALGFYARETQKAGTLSFDVCHD